MKIGILTFERFERKPLNSIGGSRIRMNNLAKYWDEAELFKYGRQYDAMIYQKVYWIEHAENFNGIKILDICDADWLHWGYRLVQMSSLCDSVTCSSEKLAEDFAKFTDKPVWYVPDRMDLNSYPRKKEHIGRATKVGWFGYSQNYSAIDDAGVPKALMDLNKKGENLELVVISNAMYMPPAYAKGKLKITNLRWTLDTVDDDILSCDIIINPKLEKANFKYKSNNKTLHSWALGVPVTTNYDELVKFIDPDNRKIEIEKRDYELKDKWELSQSITQYKDLIDIIKKDKLQEKIKTL